MDPTASLTKIATNLKIQRLTAGKSMYQVAKETGIAYTFLVDIECQRKSPSLKTLDILAKYYNVEPYELLL